MRLLITGGSGFVGTALVARLRLTHDVIAPTRAEVDLLGNCESTFDPLGTIDAVVHCAASRDRARPEPDRWPLETAINVMATARLLEWCRSRGVRRFVHISTISVLQTNTDLETVLDEESSMVTPPTHPYALTKLWAEQLAIQQRSSFDSIDILRLGHVLGPHRLPRE